MVDKSEIQKLRAEIETARGEVSRKRRKPAAPRHASASEAEPSKTEAQPSAKPHSSHTDTPGPALPGLEGVDLEAMLTKAEDALANLDEDISRHPRLAVLGALAVGLIIGSLLSR